MAIIELPLFYDNFSDPTNDSYDILAGNGVITRKDQKIYAYAGAAVDMDKYDIFRNGKMLTKKIDWAPLNNYRYVYFKTEFTSWTTTDINLSHNEFILWKQDNPGYWYTMGTHDADDLSGYKMVNAVVTYYGAGGIVAGLSPMPWEVRYIIDTVDLTILWQYKLNGSIWTNLGTIGIIALDFIPTHIAFYAKNWGAPPRPAIEASFDFLEIGALVEENDPILISSVKKNIKKLHYYHYEETDPIVIGSPGFVGYLASGNTSYLGNTLSLVTQSLTSGDGDCIDQTQWKSSFLMPDLDMSIYTSGSAYPTGIGSIYMYSTGSSELSNTFGETINLSSETRWALSGNFDIIVDVNNLTKESHAGTTAVTTSLSIECDEGTIDSGYSIQFINSTDGNNYFKRRMYKTGSVSYNDALILATGSDTILRLKRESDDISYWYHDTQWGNIGNTNATDKIDNTRNVIVKLSMGGSDVFKGFCEFDNFSINSADGVITSSGWRMETGSNYRSYDAKPIPSNMLLIGSDDGVEFYDTANYNSWMRFYTGSDQFFHLSGSGKQRVLDFDHNKMGGIYVAYGRGSQGVPFSSHADDGGFMVVDLGQNSLWTRRDTGSITSKLETASMGNYCPNYNYARGRLPERNDSASFESASSPYIKQNQGLHHNNVYSVDFYINGHYAREDDIFEVASMEDGLTVFKRKLPGKTINFSATASSDHRQLSSRHMYSKFNQSNGDLYFVTNNDFYRTSLLTISASMTSSNTTSKFTADDQVHFSGTKSFPEYKYGQYRFKMDHYNYFYNPATEGIYRSDQYLNYCELYLADSGGVFNILNPYDELQTVEETYCTDSDKNYLLYGYTNGADNGLGIILLSRNTPSSSPKLIVDHNFTGLSGSSEIRDVIVTETTRLSKYTDKINCYVAFTSSVYQFEFNVTIPYTEQCSENIIGSDFTINNYICLPTQHMSHYGDRITSVPYFLNTPLASLRNKNNPLSSSIVHQNEER